MRNMKKLITMMLMMASVFFFACSEDEDKKLSPEEAKAELNSMTDDMSVKLDEMKNAEGFKAIEALNNMPDPFVETMSSGKTTIIQNIKKYTLPLFDKTKVKSIEGNFDFEYWWGTYTWDQEHQMWTVVFDDPAVTTDDKIVIIFPADEANMNNNNATITILAYEEVELSVDGYYYYEPIDIEANIVVDGIELVGIDFAANWGSQGELEMLDVEVFVLPFTFSINFNIASVSGDIDFEILYNSESLFSIGLDATFADATMEMPINIHGYIQYLSVKFDIDIDVQNITDLVAQVQANPTMYTQEQMLEMLNNEIDAVVLVNGVKAADIEMEIDALTDEPYPVFVYTDGTSEPAQPYLEEFVLSLEDFFDFMDSIYG
ncbi:MAG TPA: hypothetical protein DCG75_19555 [Bacteroidales bacterium]|nr:hypothetical protein [Bacteroidales bacterium]